MKDYRRNGKDRNTPRGKQKVASRSNDILAKFFAQYPSFDYDATQSSSEEFYRMCDFFDWDRSDDKRREAHDDFKTALVQQFNAAYGTDAGDIESWLGLCIALDVSPLPSTLVEAKEVLKGKFVNMVDLVDRHNTGESITQFETLEELQDYTITTGKYFPKDSAYAGGVLKFLLREILHQHGRKTRHGQRETADV